MAMATAAATTNGTLLKGAKAAARALLPRAFLNWRDERFYARYGEVELHLLDLLCSREKDSIDVGANDGSYVNVMRRHSRAVLAFEPLPWLCDRLRDRFSGNVSVHQLALSNRSGPAVLRVPLVDGVAVEGCSSIAEVTKSYYSKVREIDATMGLLDDVYSGNCGFIKIDVEGHEEAVLEGATKTIARSRPRILTEIVEYLAPDGVARFTEFFSRLNYKGYFVFQRQLLPIEEFRRSRMQNDADKPDLTAPLLERERFGKFVYNFMFLPAEEADSTRAALARRVARL